MNEREMNCREALRLLAEYLDRELDATEHELVKRHLETCRDCYSRAEFERRLKGQLAALGRRPVSAAFEDRIRRTIRAFGPREVPGSG